MTTRKKVITMVLMIVFGCITMAYVDAVTRPDYAVKSVIKIVLFLTLPLGFCLVHRDISFRSIFKLERKGLAFSVLLGVSVFVVILGSYFLLGPYFDLSQITESLESNTGINAGNFIFVAIYISIVNSLLEEFFFRGFAFLTLKKLTGRKFAYIFSAGAFAVYHIAMMTSWFTIPLFLLLIISLFVAGLLFNWLNERNGNIYTSWMVHMCANLAINTIGFILFGLI